MQSDDGKVISAGPHPGVEKPLTKATLIEEVSRAVGITTQDAGCIVEGIVESMVRAINRGEKVEIRGFGTFRTRQRQARVGRNPKTGARVDVPPKRVPFFKPSKALRNLVDKTGSAPVP